MSAPKPACGVSMRSNRLINIYDPHTAFLSRDGYQSLDPSRSSRGLIIGFGRVRKGQRDGRSKVAWIIPRMKRGYEYQGGRFVRRARKVMIKRLEVWYGRRRNDFIFLVSLHPKDISQFKELTSFSGDGRHRITSKASTASESDTETPSRSPPYSGSV